MRKSRFGTSIISSVGISLSILATLIMAEEVIACYGACHDKDIPGYTDMTAAEHAAFCAPLECSGSWCGDDCEVANTRPTCKCKN